MITVDVFSDPICPWCFIGKRRIEKAMDARPDVELDIRWHAFQLNPTMPSEGMERDDYLTAKFGNPENARRLYDDIRAVGERAGIPFAFEQIARTPSTLAAHRLIRYAAGAERQSEIVERLFEAYFLDGKDLGDPDMLVRLGSAAGLKAADLSRYLASDRNRDTVRAEDMQARQLGIRGVPFFIFDRQYAISGAQEPEAFHPLFDLLLARRETQLAGSSAGF